MTRSDYVTERPAHKTRRQSWQRTTNPNADAAATRAPPSIYNTPATNTHSNGQGKERYVWARPHRPFCDGGVVVLVDAAISGACVL